MTDDYPVLADNHTKKLINSAVSGRVAKERGYRSSYTKADLRRAGFGSVQQQVIDADYPALVIPLHGVSGQPVGYQMRPDNPRTGSDGRTLKYESPIRQRMVLDVPPTCQPQLGDPDVPLVITEGPIKADALASKDICAVALLGVYGFRGRNDRDGVTALPDWESIALNNGRTVLIAFDSDVMLNPHVHDALVRLGRFLDSKGAQVGYVYLPAGEHGVKVGADDWLAGEPRRGFDDLVALARTTPLSPPSPNGPSTPSAPHEWDGVVPLPALRAALRRYLVLPEHADVAIALWVVHTYLTEHFYSTPRLSVQSPEKESGKSRLLEVIVLLARAARLWTHISAAVLYRRIGQGPVTALIDEVDNIFTSRNDPEKADLRAVLNEGYRKGATVPRCVGANRDEVAEFPVYTPVALAGIGTLPDTLTSRSLIISMKRRTANEPVEPFRERIARAELEPLREQLEAWADFIGDQVSDYIPAMPDGVTDRAADIWEPLLAIAELAGDDEAELARTACTAMVKATDDASRSLGVRLLADCKKVFATANAEALWTADLLAKLHALEDAPWASLRGEPLDARGLARLLKPYAVQSDQVWINNVNARGYRATGEGGFHEAWQRYCKDDPDPDGGDTGGDGGDHDAPDTGSGASARSARSARTATPDDRPASPPSGPSTQSEVDIRACIECGTTDPVVHYEAGTVQPGSRAGWRCKLHTNVP